MIEIISATRLSEREFMERSPLGLSLQRLLPHTAGHASRIASADRMAAYIAFTNNKPLAECYNPRILAPGEPDDILVFIHDDVWIEDFFLHKRVRDGVAQFEVLGVAGGCTRVPGQVAWKIDGAPLSGSIGQGAMPFTSIHHHGPCPLECELLDGVFLAAKRAVLQQAGVLFDPALEFHFYDLDFCRRARECGLRLGTWPIALTHTSLGNYGSDSWRAKRDLYLRKWGEPALRD
jgi:hypothetical protein